MKKILFATLAFLFLSTNARADIVVGVSLPLSGPAASFGEQIKTGTEVALADINASGGVLGQKIKLRYEDDGCEAKLGVAAANKLAIEKPTAVIGLFCSMAMTPASEIYADENIPVLFTASNTAITTRGLKNIFRVGGMDDGQARLLAEYIDINKLGDKKIALIHDKQVWGKGIVDRMQKDLADLKITPTIVDSITFGEKDFSALVAKLKKNKIDVVVLALFPVEAGLVMRQAKDAGYSAKFFGADALLTAEYWNVSGKAGEGMLFTGPMDPRKSVDGKRIVDKIKLAKGNPELYTLYAYTQLRLLADAITAAGSTDSKDIIDVLSNGSFKSVMGDLSFDRKGDLKRSLWSMYRWTNGDYVMLEGTN